MKSSRRCVVLLTLAAVSTSCGAERTWTGASVTVRAELPAVLTTRSGWVLEPRRAVLHLEALRLSEAHVALAWWRTALLGVANAHPGHGDDGAAVGELIAPMVFDLTSAQSLTWGNATTLTGDVHSLNVALAAPGVELEGVATRGAERVEFAQQFLPSSALPVPFEAQVGPAGGALTLSLDVAHLVSRLDFTTNERAAEGLARGVVDSAVWRVEWVGGAP